MSDRDLPARFSASTAGFTAGTNALKQKLTELNTNMEQTTTLNARTAMSAHMR